MSRSRSARPARLCSPPIVIAGLLALGAVFAGPANARPLPAHRLSVTLAAKLDPALLAFATGAEDSMAVWVSFRDKNPAGPAAEAESLALCWDRLTPRARARRERARVFPRVDAADLPVAVDYLDALREGGWSPFAVSRWLNRAAVRVRASELERLAAPSWVAGLAPVRFGRGIGDRPLPIEVRATPGAGGTRTGRAPRSASPRLAGAPVPSSQSGLSLSQLQQMNATAVHDSGYIGTGVLVALLDEGFNFHDKHQALRDQIVPPGFSRDFVDGDTVVTDTTRLTLFEHGTWTLGLLAGYLPGIYLGSAYGATFALARTERDGSETPSEMLYWSQGAEWADSLGADVISSSVGYNLFDSPFPSLQPSDLDGHTSEITRAAEIAASKGILVVNAVGNGGSAAPIRLVAPADVDGDSLIAAGAVDSFGSVPSFSSRGPTADGRIKPDLVARGVRDWLIAPTGPPDVYTQGDGSSFAAPLIAGLAACLIEARPSWTPTEVIRSLRETASNLCAPDNSQGWGIPDGLAALRWSPGPVTPAVPPHGYLELALQGPNPVRPARGPMRVRFGLGPRLSSTSKARLQVFDATGRLVRDLYRGSLCCGHWRIAEWDGIDHDGRAARSGLYFVNFDVEGRVSTLRVALLR